MAQKIVGTALCRVSSYTFTQCRFAKPNRHFNPKFKKLRAEKFLPVPQLDDYMMQEKIRSGDKSVTPAEVRIYMKRMGVPTIRQWRERPINMSSTGEIADQYKPVEGVGKTSLISTAKVKELSTKVFADFKSRRAAAAIKKQLSDFSPTVFPDEAKEIFINAHTALAERDEEKLHTYVTERIFPEMFDEVKLRTVKWTFIESLEAPKVVHMRVFEGLSKEYLFAQVTVRLHSRQILAVYDQFGRLMLGDPNVARDVLEYPVFERLITDDYGSWRLHGKILPADHPQQPLLRTFRPLPPPRQEPTVDSGADEVTMKESSVAQSASDQPQLAAA